MADGARPERVICVLGMHRSGTSCLAGSLEQQGLFLGEVNTAAPWNKRGNRESFTIMDLQGDVLAASGGSWDNPPAVVEWQPEHLERARNVLAEHAGHSVWGFKDPRTLLTLEGWREALPECGYVGTFRRAWKRASRHATGRRSPRRRPFRRPIRYSECRYGRGCRSRSTRPSARRTDRCGHDRRERCAQGPAARSSDAPRHRGRRSQSRASPGPPRSGMSRSSPDSRSS